MNTTLHRRLSPLLVALLLAVALMAQGAATARAAEKVPDYFFHKIVDFDFVTNYVKMPKLDGVMIIDSRPYMTQHAKGYIPTSVSIPDSEFDARAAELPKEKDALLIFYCEGAACKLSHNSARKAEKLGYTNVVVYPGGYPDWITHAGVYESVGIEYVREKIEKGEPMFLADSRPITKVLDGSIPGAMFMPASQFEARKGYLPADKSSEVVFFCEGFTCKLSHDAAIAAKRMGYGTVKVFEAGYPAWKEKFGAAQSVEIAGGEDGIMDVAVFQKALAENPGSIMVVDVRDPDEYAKGHIPQAVNIPGSQLAGRLGELPRDKPVVFVCNTGARSGEAFYLIMDKAADMKNAYYIEGTIDYAPDNSYTIKPNK